MVSASQAIVSAIVKICDKRKKMLVAGDESALLCFALLSATFGTGDNKIDYRRARTSHAFRCNRISVRWQHAVAGLSGG